MENNKVMTVNSIDEIPEEEVRNFMEEIKNKETLIELIKNKSRIAITRTGNSKVSKDTMTEDIEESNGDLMKVYYIVSGKHYVVQINKSIIKASGLTIEEIERHALKNTKAMNVSLKPLNAVLNEMLGAEILPEQDFIWVLTNEDGLFGASVILNEENLKFIKSIFKGKKEVWMIPSSVHEWLILPCHAKTKKDYDKLLKMLREVNESQIMEKEWLSNDNLYKINFETLKLEIINRDDLSE